MRNVVVFPAPFRPTKPVTEPGSTVKLGWSTAGPPNTLVSSVTTPRPSDGGSRTGSSKHGHKPESKRTSSGASSI